MINIDNLNIFEIYDKSKLYNYLRDECKLYHAIIDNNIYLVFKGRDNQQDFMININFKFEVNEKEIELFFGNGLGSVLKYSFKLTADSQNIVNYIEMCRNKFKNLETTKYYII